MTTIKRMDLTEFRRLGFLQEVNRQFFHPLGLALEMIVETGGRCECGAPEASTIHRVDSEVEEIRFAAHPFQLKGPTFGGIWDYRDDPEGIAFEDGSIDPELVDSVRALRESKRAVRVKLFGAVVQPPPGRTCG